VFPSSSANGETELQADFPGGGSCEFSGGVGASFRFPDKFSENKLGARAVCRLRVFLLASLSRRMQLSGRMANLI
jgi:hypothetical protein